MTVDEELLIEVVKGDLDSLPKKLQQLLKRGANPNAKDEHGNTSLHLLLSCWRNEQTETSRTKLLRAMDILLNGDASVDVSDGSGQNVVHLAAAVNVPSQILIPMVKKCNIDKLSVAAIHDLMSTDSLDTELLVLICESNLDLAIPNQENVTPMHQMVAKHRPVDTHLVQTLAHKRPDDFNKMKDSLLFYACRYGSKETLQALLQLGSSHAGQDVQSGLPALLHTACFVNNEEAVVKVDILLANGADIHVTSSSGHNLCHIAAQTGNASLLEKALSAGVDHTCRDAKANNPLHHACKTARNSSSILLLIDAGLDVNETNSEGHTPLHLAIECKDVDNTSALIRASADVQHAGLEAVLYHNLQILCDPEIIKASPSPVEYALRLSTFYHRMSQAQSELKENYLMLSRELEDVALRMIEELHLAQKHQMVLHGALVEMAVSDGQRKFIANEAVQQELRHVWMGCQDMSNGRLIFDTTILALKLIVLSLAFPVLLPLILCKIKVCGLSLSLDSVWPKAAPIVWYFVEAMSYSIFVLLLLVETIDFSTSMVSISSIEWITIVFAFSLFLNELQTLVREGWRFYFSQLDHIKNNATLLLFMVSFLLRIVSIHDRTESSNQTLRGASYMLAAAEAMACTRMLQYLRVHQRLGPIQRSFNKMREVVMYFTVILFAYLLAYAIAMANVYGATYFRVNGTEVQAMNCPAESFDGVFHSGSSLFWSLFGLTDVSSLDNCTKLEQMVGKLLFAVWLVQAVIILLNVLIALVTNKFEEVQNNADIEWKFSLAATIVDVQKSRRVPVPFNLVLFIVEGFEWLVIGRHSKMKHDFKLLSDTEVIQGDSGHGNHGNIELEAYEQAELKKALAQTATRGDLREMNKRLLGLEASFARVRQSLDIHPSPEEAGLSDEQKGDTWSSYRNRIHSCGLSEDSIWATEIAEQNPSGQQRPQSSPGSDDLTRVLVSLQQSMKQQGEALKQIQSQLMKLDCRPKPIEPKQPAVTAASSFEAETSV